jgi:hypothetical protein
MASNGTVIAGLGAWAALVLSAFAAVTSYKSTPGAAAEPPAEWPAASDIERDADRPTLLMFAHPRCPCTRASIDELGKLIDAAPNTFSAHVLFMKPAGADGAWQNTDTVARARALEGAATTFDGDSAEAARFGAHVSGEVLLYGRSGELLFRGGITPGRGHPGDSLGRQRLLAILAGNQTDRTDAPTFGCNLDTRANNRRDP